MSGSGCTGTSWGIKICYFQPPHSADVQHFDSVHEGVRVVSSSSHVDSVIQEGSTEVIPGVQHSWELLPFTRVPVIPGTTGVIHTPGVTWTTVVIWEFLTGTKVDQKLQQESLE